MTLVPCSLDHFPIPSQARPLSPPPTAGPLFPPHAHPINPAIPPKRTTCPLVPLMTSAPARILFMPPPPSTSHRWMDGAERRQI